MTDLANKFATFESQVSTQHTELMEALNSIAFALGAPPTTPTTTLADLSTQLNALIDGIALIYSANTTYQASTLALLGQINTNTDLMLTNNSLNAQRLIAAIYATFCECVTEIPLLGPPLDITPTVIVDEAKCRRIQFYLSVFGNWLNAIANYGNAGAAITGGTLAYLLSVVAADAGIVATGVEVGAVGGIPGVVTGAVVGLIVVAVYTFGGSVLVDYANQFNDPTLRDNMVQAMYAATNADEGYSAFKTTLLASMATIPAELIYTLWWSAWSNDVYSGSPVVDDSAFDGSICLPDSPCQTLTSTQSTFGNDGTGEAIIWPSPIEASDHTPANYYTQFAMWATTNLVGWSFTPSVNVLLVQNWNIGGVTVNAGTTYTLGNTDHCIIYTFPSTTPFTIELCPPA